MLLRFGKTPKTLDEPRDTADDVTEADFIPYAFHYSPHALLTKNGELLQILHITANRDGTDYESPEPGQPSLRDAIRNAIGGAVDSQRYAYWFHTIRRKQAISHDVQFKERFAADLHNAWQTKHRWQYSYTNEIYISILREGKAEDLKDFKSLGRNLISAQTRKNHDAYLENSAQELDAVTRRIMEGLSGHSNVRRLAMVERTQEGKGSVLFSEPLEMLYYLINLQPAAIPVTTMDASRQLAGCELTFGFDAMESRGSEKGAKRFCGMLTLKGAPELSPQVLDKCLQLPEELIITQSFNYMPSKQALEKQQEIKTLIESNPDPLIARVSGLKAILESDQGKATDFGEQQTSIAIIRDQYKPLDAAIGEVQQSFAKLGLISVREELMLEDCYWAQLPGNFAFLRRRAPLASRRMAGLARLNHFPSGSKHGSPWGAPAAILPTILSTPYFFNFHDGANGHTAFLDFNSFADECGAALLNFLLASSRHAGGRLFIIDRNRASAPLVEALGGSYWHPLGEREGLPWEINPFQLEDTPRNRAFLASWLSHFVREDAQQEEATRETLKQAVDEIFALPREMRSVAKARTLLAASRPGLLAEDSTIGSALFGGVRDTLDLSAAVCGVEMLEAIKSRKNIAPLFAYLLHRIALTLDGKPAIIVLNEAWDLLDNDFFMPRIASLLAMLQQNNAIVIFTTRKFDEHVDSYLTQQVMKLCATRLFVPDDVLTEYYPEATGLTAREAKLLTCMDRQKGNFLIKHGNEVVECVLPIDGIDRYWNTLAGDAQALRLMQIQQR